MRYRSSQTIFQYGYRHKCIYCSLLHASFTKPILYRHGDRQRSGPTWAVHYWYFWRIFCELPIIICGDPNEIIQKGKHGISLSPDLIQMLIMLFADDVILLSFTITGLQHQLNIFNDAANNLGLVVNLSKSNVVFRNGGHLALREKWFYNGTRLAVVNQYKCLGVIFSTWLTFSYCLEDMAIRAKKGVIGILKLLWTLAEQSPTLFFRLFDCQIQPMLTYGAEVWGIMADHSTIERVHLFAIKRLLNVSTRTPSTLVYGETGEIPSLYNNLCEMH